MTIKSPAEPMLHERRFRERPCCRPIVSRSVTLPTVAMAAAAAAVPTFSWTYKAGQRQRPLLLGPEHFSGGGHPDGAAPSPPQRFEDFTSVSFKTLGGQGHKRGQGGGVDLSVHVRTRPALNVPWEKTKGVDCDRSSGVHSNNPPLPLCKLSGSAEGSAEEHDSRGMRYRLLACRSPRVLKKTYILASRQPSTDCRLQLEPFSPLRSTKQTAF